jgi:hypothetical protein
MSQKDRHSRFCVVVAGKKSTQMHNGTVQHTIHAENKALGMKKGIILQNFSTGRRIANRYTKKYVAGKQSGSMLQYNSSVLYRK